MIIRFITGRLARRGISTASGRKEIEWANNVGCASFITSEGFRLPVRASLFGA